MKVFWKRALLEKLRSSKETSRIVRDFLVDEITESTGRKINELKEYFYKLEGYNKRIASADIAYLEGTNYLSFSIRIYCSDSVVACTCSLQRGYTQFESHPDTLSKQRISPSGTID